MTRFPNQRPSPSSASSQWAGGSLPVAMAPAETRADFIRKTYLHVAGAVLAMVGILTAYFTIVPEETQFRVLQTIGGGGMTWLIVLGAYMGVSWLANKWAADVGSPGKQYAGLAIYTLAISLIMIPLLTIAINIPAFAEQNLVLKAAATTLIVFGGLTAFVFTTGVNFSFLKGITAVGFLIMLAVIVVGVIFGFDLGLWVIIPMIGLLCASILWQTSAVMEEYPVGAHVAAALGLFASLATLFYYILALFMRMSDE